MSEDLQRNRWWLASDGRWYPPELHPSVRADTPDENERNRALLNATIGVARVRERVFAEVSGEHRYEHNETARRETSGIAERRGLGQEVALRRESDSPPRFRARETPRGPRAVREPSQAITSSSEPRWSPGKRDPRQPPARTSSWHDRLEAERLPRPTQASWPATPSSSSSPLLVRERLEITAERHWPPARGLTPGPAPPSRQIEASLPVPPAAPSALQEDLTPSPFFPPPVETTSPEVQVLSSPPMQIAGSVTEPVQALVEDSPKVAPPPPSTDLLEGRVLLPSARRRPSRVRSTSDLRSAVAGAVTRAAAQGPLMPRGQERDVVSDSSQERDETTVEPEGAGPTDSAGQRPPAAEAPPSDATFEVPTADTEEDPSDYHAELAQLYGEIAARDAWTTPSEVPLANVVISHESPIAPLSHSEAVVESEAALAETLLDAAFINEAIENATLVGTTPVTEAFTGPVGVDGDPLEPVAELLDKEQPSAQVDPQSEGIREEDPSWAFAERRSAARQARKPLPAALKEAVAAGAAQDESVSHPGFGNPSQSTRSRPQDSGDGQSTGKGKTKKAGVLRRYGSAIAIVVLFVAAGGAAAAIAAFRGPVAPPAPTTTATYPGAANTDFPSAWHESSGNSPTSYGLGSALVTASTVSAWLTKHVTCSGDLDAVSAAMTPNKDNATAVAYTQATTTNPLGGPWQIADAVALNTSAAALSNDIAKIRAVLGTAKAQQCVAGFWSTALRAELPAGSLVMMNVSLRAVPNLPGRPLGWVMKMIGSAVLNHVSLPLRFQITVFAAGRTEVFFVVSSKGAALPGNLAGKLLGDLATQAERLHTAPA